MGHEECCRFLLLAKANPNLQDWTKATPLHKAAWNDHAEVCLLLVTSNASLHIRDEDGESPIDGAASVALTDVFLREAMRQELIENGSVMRSAYAPGNNTTSTSLQSSYLFEMHLTSRLCRSSPAFLLPSVRNDPKLSVGNTSRKDTHITQRDGMGNL